jgi:Cytochrome c7 and related cytochrome c/Class III cytochrome C family
LTQVLRFALRVATGVCPLAVRLTAGGGMLIAAFAASMSLAFAGDKIEQPIEFPHDVHAGKMGINCLYCHTYARRSAVSGIPPLQKCIGCHENIESVKDSPRIKKLFEYWEAKQPIPWKKIHNLPDFVRFNHERHIQRFYFQQGRPIQEVCGLCHGDVKTMTVAEKVTPLTMGWCVSCHEQDHKVDSLTAKTSNGPNDCSYCHK